MHGLMIQPYARQKTVKIAHRALAFGLQNINTGQKTFPKVFEQRTVNRLQRVLVGGIDAYVQLGDRDEGLHLVRKLQVSVTHELLIQTHACTG